MNIKFLQWQSDEREKKKEEKKKKKRKDGAAKRSTVYREHTVDVRASRERKVCFEKKEKKFIFLFTFLTRDILAAVVAI